MCKWKETKKLLPFLHGTSNSEFHGMLFSKSLIRAHETVQICTHTHLTFLSASYYPGTQLHTDI